MIVVRTIRPLLIFLLPVATVAGTIGAVVLLFVIIARLIRTVRSLVLARFSLCVAFVIVAGGIRAGSAVYTLVAGCFSFADKSRTLISPFVNGPRETRAARLFLFIFVCFKLGRAERVFFFFHCFLPI